MSQIFTLDLWPGNENKKGEVKLYVRILPQNIKLPTSVRIPAKSWGKQKVVGTQAALYNKILSNELDTVKQKCLKVLARGHEITKEALKGSGGFYDYCQAHIDLNRSKFSKGRIAHLTGAMEALKAFAPGLTFEGVSSSVLRKFEASLAGLQSSTIRSKMNMVLSFVNAAERDGLIERAQYSQYRRPSAKSEVPVWLTEAELKAFLAVVLALGNERKQNTAYYFLLSCYTGYRISDCKAFDSSLLSPGEGGAPGILTLRAKKNGEIVSIPVYPDLEPVLNYCLEHPFLETEQHARETVRSLCGMAGIRKYVKFHSGRHTFAMRCLQKGLTKDEVAKLLGDTRQVVEVYARIINSQLHKSVMEKLG